MAGHVLRSGYDLIVHDPRGEAVAAAASAGARIGGSVAEVAAGADIVFACLPSPAVSEEVAAQLFAAPRRPQIYVEHSTLRPDTVRGFAQEAAKTGVGFLDAPISGGPAARESGTIAIMVGGEADILASVQPVMSTYGGKILHLGPVGSGCVAKLTHNTIGFTTGMAIMEALLMGVRNGVPMDRLSEAVMAGASASPAVAHIAGQYISRAYRHDGRPDVAMRHGTKDLALGLAMAADSGWDLPTSTAAYEVWRRATDAGYGERETMAMMDFLENGAAPVAKR
jgi:3-hydroxyisobutyrate dehydrogenase-like beta-hydroxyacid dehydrogenase